MTRRSTRALEGVLSPDHVNSLRLTLRGLRARARTRVGLVGLPGCVIIGAQRSGTTSLHQDLAKHPAIEEAIGKELQYFTVNHDRGLDWYRGHFPPAKPGQISCEASPYYLFHPAAPERAARALPQARFVAILRDPVERAYSHYQHSRRFGFEQLNSFAEALDAEPERLRSLGSDGAVTATEHDIARRYSYIARGRYAGQLDRWWRAVGRDRLLVLRSEDYHRDPAPEYLRLLSFLGLDPVLPETFAHHTKRVGTAETMDPGVRARLRETFSEDSAQVAQMLGWRRAWPDA